MGSGGGVGGLLVAVHNPVIVRPLTSHPWKAGTRGALWGMAVVFCIARSHMKAKERGGAVWCFEAAVEVI